METIIAKLQELVTLYGLKIITAVMILFIGRWIARIITNVVRRLLTRAEVDPTLVSFVGNLAYYAALVFVVVAALGQLGIQTTSFIAVLGAAGLAVGLALQGSLANFAAGLLMILFRPFQVGHYIEGAGSAGTVKEIHIFTTYLTTPDNKLVVIPNAKLMGDNIVNYSANDTRRVDMTVGVSYHDDLKKVRQVLGELIDQEERILPDPEPTIAVSALADHSVNFVIRAWVNTPDYWGVYYDLTERVKTRFDEEGISIPFPQREIRVVEKISA